MLTVFFSLSAQTIAFMQMAGLVGGHLQFQEMLTFFSRVNCTNVTLSSNASEEYLSVTVSECRTSKNVTLHPAKATSPALLK